MITFIDGPAKGQPLSLARTPIMLRVVHDSAANAWDALDQLDDTPKTGERIYLYRLAGKPTWMHLDGRDKNGRRWGRTEWSADYAFYAEQPPDADMRTSERWAAWCTARQAELQTEKANGN